MLVPKLDYLQYIAVKGVFTYLAGQISGGLRALRSRTTSAAANAPFGSKNGTSQSSQQEQEDSGRAVQAMDRKQKGKAEPSKGNEDVESKQDQSPSTQTKTEMASDKARQGEQYCMRGKKNQAPKCLHLSSHFLPPLGSVCLTYGPSLFTGATFPACTVQCPCWRSAG